MKKQQIQQQKQITISAYTMEVIQKSFVNTLRWLEHYIEKSGYSDNWQKQIPEPIIRQDLNDQPSEIKGFMETALLALDGVIDDKPDFVLEGLQEQFYSWLDKSGIRADNCPEELVECLANIHKVLTRDGKEFVERVDREASEDIAKMTLEERRKNFYQTFTLAQKFMDGAKARKQSLEGKTYKDVETKNRFTGSHEQGKKIFGQIKDQQSTNSLQAGFQQRTNFEIIQDVRQNPQNWRLDEVITEYDNQGRAIKKEMALIHSSAQISFDGSVLGNNQPVYLAQRFDQREVAEINQVLNVSQQQQTQQQASSYEWSWK